MAWNNASPKRTLLVCCGTGCLATGAREVVAALQDAIDAAGANAAAKPDIKCTGCNGFCENGPIVKVHPDDISYYRVRPRHAAEIVSSLGGEPFKALLYHDGEGCPVTRQADNPFYAGQHKIALRNIGEIDPFAIEDYMERGGYMALAKVVSENTPPERIVREVMDSGLRGRGGAGFPTGVKWQTAAGYDTFPKYVCCNADEGDPGAFMDRSTLEGDPHSVIEGMAICACAIGAEKGFIYIRDEYGLALGTVKAAILAAEGHGFLGDDILGSGRAFSIEIVRGGGAFVCGESTALMHSIEGRVGEPRAKYIRSVQSGLWGRPTVLNNVETFANIPYILTHGGSGFAKLGTDGSSGTKVFSLVGKVNRTGLVEVPMGASLRRLIFDIGGGVKRGRAFKAVQTGGPSGGCLPESMLDLEVDFDRLAEMGAMMGSGGMIVMDEHDCMVEVARYYTNFLSEESCGKCTPCREGLRQMLQVLTDICEGRGQEGDVELLERLGGTLQDASLCALGKTAPNPVLSTIKHFRAEYDAHIREKRCPAGVCAKLAAFAIDAETCTGCGACKKACPIGAIAGDVKTVDAQGDANAVDAPDAAKDVDAQGYAKAVDSQGDAKAVDAPGDANAVDAQGVANAVRAPFAIARDACIACGSCRDACRFGAVYAERRQS